MRPPFAPDLKVTAPMHKLLILTDLHITQPGTAIIGLDPEARLRSVLSRALRDHPDAAYLIFLGDLTHHGLPQEYSRLKAIVQDLITPRGPRVLATIGNHDTRAVARSHLPWLAQDSNGFAQASLSCGGTRILLLDTVDETGALRRHAGHLCDTRLDWLRAELVAAPEKRLLVLLHHPPMRTGFAGMDDIRLINGDDLLGILSADGRPAHLVCGHVHRTISGSVGQIGYSVFKSPCHQMPLSLGDSSTGLSVDEPGAYGLILLTPQGPIVHSEDVFERPASFHQDDASA